MTKEEKRKIKWLISSLTRDFKDFGEEIAGEGDRYDLQAHLKYVYGTFAELKRRLKESGVLK